MPWTADVQAFGAPLAGGDDSMDSMVPNNGIILIGEDAPASAKQSSTERKLQLPNGCKILLPDGYALGDGNVLSCKV